MRAPRGTRDLLPGEIENWHRLEETTRRVFHAFGLPIPGTNPLRWTGVALTFTMIVASAGYALYLRFTL